MIMARRRLGALLLFLGFIALLTGAVFAVEMEETCADIVAMKMRSSLVSIIEFGGVGDGQTLNTEAFQRAIARIEETEIPGGTTLYVPEGVWLTGPFNLTSHMTLFLARNAVVKATQDTTSWPLIEPLPSYGRGRELPGGRYISLILGNSINDVVITGENGTIDGQGDVWWNMWRQKTLPFTRPNLVEFMHSTDIIISDIVLQNSPFWNIHPVYCSNVVVRNLTILAPHDSPNTDGVDPDSSLNVCIEDCYISTGDDLIAIKSGWDEYGIAYGRRSSDITVRRITGSSPFAGFAIGSETSGGVENVLAENLHIFNSGIGIHIKTNTGRGGYIRNVTISDVNMRNVRKGMRIAGNVGDHPDTYDPKALPLVNSLTLKNVVGVGIQQPGSITGINDSHFTRICLDNVKFDSSGRRFIPWSCTDVSGGAVQVQPSPCNELISTNGMNSCGFGV